jgi:hypothetical protein
MEWNRLIDLKSINNIVSLMGGTIRYLPYLKILDLSYKLIACVHHQYGQGRSYIGARGPWPPQAPKFSPKKFFFTKKK